MKEILEILRELKGLEWPSRRGGVVYAFGIFLLSSAVITIFAKTGIVLGSYWIIGTLLGLQLIHIIAWFIKRNFFYDPSVLTVAFAVATEETSQGYYKEIKKKFREQYNGLGKLDNSLRYKSVV